MYFEDRYYDEKFYQSKIFDFYFKDLKLGVLDIETTGLNPEKSKMILGGILMPINSGIRTLQFFSETRDEEASILNDYLSELSNFDVLISYNGDNFDLPFINRRLKANNISLYDDHPSYNYLALHQSFDLYRIVNRYSTLRKILPNLKQKTVEAYMGLWYDRTDQISGAESVELYHKFLITKNPSIRETIMLHNLDDILQLSKLIRILEKLDLHKIMYYSGFIVSNYDTKLYIKIIALKKDVIYISGLHRNINMDYSCYGVNYEARISKVRGDFYLKIPYKLEKNCCYIDLEEQLIDCSPLEKYPGFQSGYLIIKDGLEIRYAEINHLIQLILKEILKEI